MHEGGRTTLYTQCQQPTGARDLLAATFGGKPADFRIVNGDIGGGFGMKTGLQTEDAIVAYAARKLGQISHEVLYRMTPPGEPESLEVFAVDTWMDAAGMQSFYADAAHMSPLGAMLAGPPTTSVWREAPGAWVEW